MASCFALDFGIVHWITSISSILCFVALFIFSLWSPSPQNLISVSTRLSCKFVGLVEATLNIQSAMYFYPTATE